MKDLSIEKIKLEMKLFTDFHGGDLLGVDRIDECSTKEELAKIIDEHSNHLEMMLSDAKSQLDNFKKRMGLTIIDY